MSTPSTYQSLPPTYAGAKPLLDQALQLAATTGAKVQGSSKKPYPPRSVMQMSSMQVANGYVLVAWELPVKASDVAGFKVYLNSEFTGAIVLRNPQQLSYNLFAPGINAVWVSCINAQGVESQKVGIKTQAAGTSSGYTKDFIKRSQIVGGR